MFLIGFQDVILLLIALVLYLVIVKVKSPKPMKVLVLSKNCEVCKTPRALDDLEQIDSKREFGNGSYEWFMQVCKNNYGCKREAITQLDTILEAEATRRMKYQ